MKTAMAISPMMTNVLSVAKIPPAAVKASQMARIAAEDYIPMIRPMYPVCAWCPWQAAVVQAGRPGPCGPPGVPGRDGAWSRAVTARPPPGT